MFLIRRKSDGKYFKNRQSYAGRCSPKDDEWTSDPNDCQPFRTIAAAKTSRGWPSTHKYINIFCDGTWDDHIKRCGQGRHKIKINYSDRYEAVKVRIQVILD